MIVLFTEKYQMFYSLCQVHYLHIIASPRHC